MENREPYEIRRVMIVYNAFQTVFSFWMFKESWAFFVSGDYSWHCQPVDYSNNDQVLLSPLKTDITYIYYYFDHAVFLLRLYVFYELVGGTFSQNLSIFLTQYSS